MELVSPAGNLEKLLYAWEYGADAAYIGLKNFSLRAKADNFFEDEYTKISHIKNEYKKNGNPKKLFCAINISFNNQQLKNLCKEISYFHQYPFDAFIVQDVGAARILKKHFPNATLHLSTQANCINYEAVKTYQDLGFSRIVIGREASLAEIAEIKQHVPEMEIEAFVHGAMCIAYSGRCLLSAYMTARSANEGKCAQSCRWNYKPLVLEESERHGEYFPLELSDEYTAVLSSKDLCMIDYLEDFKKAGVNALKIEGRMKSIYYTALVTRAYRKKIDFINKRISIENAQPFINELYNTAHRDFSTGFYFSKKEANKTTIGATSSPYVFGGKIGKQIAPNQYEFFAMNKLTANMPLEYIGPNIVAILDNEYSFIDPETNETRHWICHGHPCILQTSKAIQEHFLVRVKSTL